MPKWKIEIYEEKDDTTPSRTEVIEADSEGEAAEQLVERLKTGAQRGDATPASKSFVLDNDKLSGSGKLG